MPADELPFSRAELERELSKSNKSYPEKPFGQMEMDEQDLVIAGAIAAWQLLPTPPEFRIEHDDPACSSGVVYGYLDTTQGDLRLECQSCGHSATLDL